nr:hypothetical protein [Micromonospora sp. DSM 115978]
TRPSVIGAIRARSRIAATILLCDPSPDSARRPAVDKIIKYGAIAFVIFFVVTAPDSAASIIERAIDGLESIGNGVSEFVTDTAL